jgi:DNA-binding protein HU-beta
VREAKEILRRVGEAFGDQLRDEGKVRIPGVGTFVAEEREARIVQTPLMTAPKQMPASMVVKYRPEKRMKESL